jgi:hypothetical protein
MLIVLLKRLAARVRSAARLIKRQRSRRRSPRHTPDGFASDGMLAEVRK